MDQFRLQVLAQTSAHRELIANMYAHRLLNEPDPVGAAMTLKAMFSGLPTVPPKESGDFDPVTSDLLAAMTDEAIQDVLDRVIVRLEHFFVPN